VAATDNFSVRLTFADGSVGTVQYAADAPKGPGKEQFETSSPGAYGVLDDFKEAAVWDPARRRLGRGKQDKGFNAQYSALAAMLVGDAEAPDAATFLISSLATLAASRSLETGQPERVMLGAED
jgi:hypothetical protein